MLALDGNDVEQQKCDAVVISPGESTDILVSTNQRADNYYIHFKTLSVNTLQVWSYFIILNIKPRFLEETNGVQQNKKETRSFSFNCCYVSVKFFLFVNRG